MIDGRKGYAWYVDQKTPYEDFLEHEKGIFDDHRLLAPLTLWRPHGIVSIL